MIIKPCDLSDVFDLISASSVEVKRYVERNPNDKDLKKLHDYLLKAVDLAALY